MVSRPIVDQLTGTGSHCGLSGQFVATFLCATPAQDQLRINLRRCCSEGSCIQDFVMNRFKSSGISSKCPSKPRYTRTISFYAWFVSSMRKESTRFVRWSFERRYDWRTLTVESDGRTRPCLQRMMTASDASNVVQAMRAGRAHPIPTPTRGLIPMVDILSIS